MAGNYSTKPIGKNPGVSAGKKPASTTSSKKSSSSVAGSKKASSGGSSISGGSSGGSSGGIQKTSDKPQVSALQSLLNSGFAAQREAKLKNAFNLYAVQDADLVKGYNSRIAGLVGSRDDNRKAESDASFGNLANRAREMSDLTAQAASVGAGETDTLKTQLMAVRNWDANQDEINRSYFDTQRSVNASINDLNADTRAARMNLAADALGDYEQIWANYYNQRADAWAQMGNINANPYSDSYNAKSTAYANMAKDAASSWKSPGINKSLQNWTGTVGATEQKLNNSNYAAGAQVKERKRPEGSTLKGWD